MFSITSVSRSCAAALLLPQHCRSRAGAGLAQRDSLRGDEAGGSDRERRQQDVPADHPCELQPRQEDGIEGHFGLYEIDIVECRRDLAPSENVGLGRRIQEQFAVSHEKLRKPNPDK